jgi:Permeases of the drug/metabolite transporter (DMT) superfamily
MRKSTAVIFLILANLFWAGNYISGKFVIAELTPIQITFLRWLIAMAILFPLAQWLEKPDWRAVWGEWKVLFVLSLLGIIGYNILLYEALYFMSPLNAALINSVNPAVIAIFAVWLLKEKMTWLNWLGIFISLTGVLLVLTHGDLLKIFVTRYNFGDLIMLLVIFVWTFYTLIAKKMKPIPPVAATAVSVTLGVLAMLPFFIVSGFSWRVSSSALYGVLYLALFPSVCSLVFWNSAVRVVGAGRSGIFMNLLTVFTALISLMLGAPIAESQIVGGLLVILGVYFTNRKANTEKRLLAQ